MVLNRGDICLINFDPSKGGKMGKLRPAIVMSSSEENHILNTCIVIPLSTVIEKNALPYRFHISKRDRLLQESDACMYEIRSLSKTRIKEKLSSLSLAEIDIIQKAICEILL